MSLFGNKQTGEAGVGGARGKAGKSGYGIAETTLLMRSLPVDQNVELVVRVVRSTLESMNVQLPEIIEDAAAKEQELQGRMATLNGEIAEFSKQIESRRQEIARLEEELTETTTVKERLLLAQKLAGKPATIPVKMNGPKDASQAVTPPPLPLRIPAKSAVG
jgi:TolA-binding protein